MTAVTNFDLCYYGQANSQTLKSSVASKWACIDTLVVTFFLLSKVPGFFDSENEVVHVMKFHVPLPLYRLCKGLKVCLFAD